ncbi:hypothetical protein BP6252_09822 [Coleophoma cylindrospora]|uniref:DUF7905 domain-containing protein n=1 Tax=Coleophoma cylindrospora TaxID=1849047 RepID=A0A3D8QWN9_9HELO|nr:hypothetical protein BP6252_09822 [Coleophoma cylindrospora]
MDNVRDFEYDNAREWNESSDDDDAVSVASSSQRPPQQSNPHQSQDSASNRLGTLIDIESDDVDSASIVHGSRETAATATTDRSQLQRHALSTRPRRQGPWGNIVGSTAPRSTAVSGLSQEAGTSNPVARASLPTNTAPTPTVNPSRPAVLPNRGPRRGRGRGVRYPDNHGPQRPAPRHEPPHRGQQSSGIALPFRAPISIGRPPHHEKPPRRVRREPYQTSQGAKSSFGAAEGLVSTRMRKQIDQRSTQANELQKFLGQPDEYEDFNSIGYYIWPDKDERATDRLGLKLEALNPVRTKFKVYIDWVDSTRCIRVRSQEKSSTGESMHSAINAIRQEHEHKKSQQKISAPVHILVPPTIKNWRSHVKPVLATTTSDDTPDRKKSNIIALELSGSPLPFGEMTKEKYDLVRFKKLEDNMARFEANLIEKIMAQSPYKGWMRLRVNFGHVKITQYEKGFAGGNYSLDKFENMIKQPRFTAEFDRDIGGASVAFDTIKNITSRPDLFVPASPKVYELKDVHPIYTEVLFVQGHGGQKLRIEAELDVLGDSTEKDRWYQLGTIQLYHDDKRYRVVEVRNIDIENRFDWNLDVVADDSVSDIPRTLYELVESSIQVSTKERFDEHGMGYPIVLPKPIYGVHVEAVCIKSVLKYILKRGGYVVEVTIFRKWPGRDTSSEPETSCAISIGHQRWDHELASMQGVVAERTWEENLSNLFPPDQLGGNGFVDLVDQIRHIREILSMNGIGR